MTTDSQAPRGLSIGDFAAATQLSLKALRLYAEQRLLMPARVDESTGYRYYRSDQVAKGRLIRTLREMGLSLADISAVVCVREVAARRLLSAFAKERDQRYAREKRAYQAALVQLQPAAPSQVPMLAQRQRGSMIVACREFMCEREDFLERCRAESQDFLAALALAQLELSHPPHCRLIDPLSEEEGRAEIVVAVMPMPSMPAGMTFRQLTSAPCAAITLRAVTHASQFAGALDTLFDWFDRHGHAIIDCPSVTLVDAADGLQVEICWPFKQTANS